MSSCGVHARPTVVASGTIVAMSPAIVAAWSTFIYLDVERAGSKMSVGIEGFVLVVVGLLVSLLLLVVVVVAAVIIVVVVGWLVLGLVHVVRLLHLECLKLLLDLGVCVSEVGNGALGGLMARSKLCHGLLHL